MLFFYSCKFFFASINCSLLSVSCFSASVIWSFVADSYPSISVSCFFVSDRSHAVFKSISLALIIPLWCLTAFVCSTHFLYPLQLFLLQCSHFCWLVQFLVQGLTYLHRLNVVAVPYQQLHCQCTTPRLPQQYYWNCHCMLEKHLFPSTTFVHVAFHSSLYRATHIVK